MVVSRVKSNTGIPNDTTSIKIKESLKFKYATEVTFYATEVTFEVKLELFFSRSTLLFFNWKDMLIFNEWL